MKFMQKLGKIDEVIQNQLFKGTMETIEPQYCYKPDEILDPTIKKRKLFNVGDNFNEKFKDMVYMNDHRGNILTKSGSKYENIAEMIERTENHRKRNQS